MQRKFFIRRFLRYLFWMMIPTLLVFVFSLAAVQYELDERLDRRAVNTLANVNNNLELMVSNVAYQNEQLTNNSYTALALKRLLRGDASIPYSDAIYLRNIKSTLRSIIQVYPYIQSVYLYLDGYDSFFSSDYGVLELEGSIGQSWYSGYRSMKASEYNMMETRSGSDSGYGRSILTVYQRMRLQEGVVVMNIDVRAYLESLDKILQKDDEAVLYFNSRGSLLLSWNDADDAAAQFDIDSFVRSGRQNTWQRLGRQRYLVHASKNTEYELCLVSLISAHAKASEMLRMTGIFFAIFLLNTAVVMCLAYQTTRRTFRQLDYMIQVFYDAEGGVYPTQPRQEVKDEYDVLMNNIIYLFLRTVKLKGELAEKRHNQEVAQLTALQLQINPHFLFNTLQTVQFQVKSGSSSREALTVLEDLSDILKYALSDPMEKISLREELAYLKKYVAIQKFRFGEKFIIYYEIEEELMDLPVFRLMLQPLVENSILHGIREKEGRGYIKVQMFRRRESVYVRVVDNGVGMSRQEKERLRASMQEINVHHIGLNNVNSRLKLRFGEEAGILIRSKRGMGCVMEFHLPWEMQAPIPQEKNKNDKN